MLSSTNASGGHQSLHRSQEIHHTGGSIDFGMSDIAARAECYHSSFSSVIVIHARSSRQYRSRPVLPASAPVTVPQPHVVANWSRSEYCHICHVMPCFGIPLSPSSPLTQDTAHFFTIIVAPSYTSLTYFDIDKTCWSPLFAYMPITFANAPRDSCSTGVQCPDRGSRVTSLSFAK